MAFLVAVPVFRRPDLAERAAFADFVERRQRDDDADQQDRRNHDDSDAALPRDLLRFEQATALIFQSAATGARLVSSDSHHLFRLTAIAADVQRCERIDARVQIK